MPLAAKLLGSRLGASSVRSLQPLPTRTLARPSLASVAAGQSTFAAQLLSLRSGDAHAASAQRSCSSVANIVGQPSVSEQPLVRISYMSKMKGDSEEVGETIKKIAERSAGHNVRESITGFMSYDATLCTVWQILEGETDTVMQLWDRIQRDGRHTVDDETVCIESAATRAYPFGWGLKVRVHAANEI